MGLWVLLVAGFALGFLGSIPVAGPIALLVFSLILDGRYRRAVFVAVGAAVAEGVYAFLAFWGASEFLAGHPGLVPFSRGFAAVILAAIGIALIRRRPAAAPPLKRSWPTGGLFLGFAITAVNPTLIGTWTAAVTMLFSTGLLEFTPASAIPFGLAAMGGIVAWFALLVVVGRRFLERFQRETLNRVVRVMGVLALLAALGFAVSTVLFLVR
jgi:threonine/homoserine/homoserine lactone efflux protein